MKKRENTTISLCTEIQLHIELNYRNQPYRVRELAKDRVDYMSSTTLWRYLAREIKDSKPGKAWFDFYGNRYSKMFILEHYEITQRTLNKYLAKVNKWFAEYFINSAIKEVSGKCVDDCLHS